MNREELAERLMRRLCAFPSFRPSKNLDTAEAYRVAIVGMLRDFGSERTYEAITAVIDAGGQFPPSVGDLRRFISVERDERIAADGQLEAENARLKELLTYYGEHTCQCGVPVGKPPCVCGWSKVLVALLGDEDAEAVENFRAYLGQGIADGSVQVLMGEPEGAAQ